MKDIISASQYEQIADRYQFKNLEAAARDRSTMIAIATGGVLLCLGVITFVAANWQAWPREVKFILMMSLFFSVSIIGFYTRQATLGKSEGKKSQRSKRLLGEALLILGAFILGANIVLMAQIFNINGSSYRTVFCLGIWCFTHGLQSVLKFLGNYGNYPSTNRVLGGNRRLVLYFRLFR